MTIYFGNYSILILTNNMYPHKVVQGSKLGE